jgi:uncharacterized protein
MNWYQKKEGSVTLTLHIQPGAKRTEVAGLHGDALKIRVAAPPVEGAANAALLNFLKKAFAVPAAQITLKHGATGRHKVIEIAGSAISPESLLPP